MSLAVAVRAYDSIAVAADTLTTVVNAPPAQGGQSVAYPGTESATKVFRFLESYGVSVVGNPIVAGRSVSSILGELEAEIASLEEVELTVKAVGERIGNRIRSMLAAAGEASAVHLLCSGFDDTPDAQPSSMEIRVHGDKMSIPAGSPYEGLGTTISGDGYVVQALWALAKTRKAEPGFSIFSLRDAADHARFLVEATIGFQRFHLVPQAVGGGVDIAVIERRRGFRWIQRASRLDGER